MFSFCQKKKKKNQLRMYICIPRMMRKEPYSLEFCPLIHVSKKDSKLFWLRRAS